MMAMWQRCNVQINRTRQYSSLVFWRIELNLTSHFGFDAIRVEVKFGMVCDLWLNRLWQMWWGQMNLYLIVLARTTAFSFLFTSTSCSMAFWPHAHDTKPIAYIPTVLVCAKFLELIINNGFDLKSKTSFFPALHSAQCTLHTCLRRRHVYYFSMFPCRDVCRLFSLSLSRATRRVSYSLVECTLHSTSIVHRLT